MSKDVVIHNKPWVTRLSIANLIFIWVAGLRDAIVGGLMPGYVRYPLEHPYPIQGVFIFCLIISIEFTVLLALLRPFTFSWRRMLIALAIYGSLLIADSFLVSGWPDLPGYYHSNFFFLSLIVGFLLIVFVLKAVVSLSAAKPNCSSTS